MQTVLFAVVFDQYVLSPPHLCGQRGPFPLLTEGITAHEQYVSIELGGFNLFCC